MKRYYAYFFEGPGSIVDMSNDDLAMGTLASFRYNVNSFLSQTGESYIDRFGVIHDVTPHSDEPYLYLFEISDDPAGVYDEIETNLKEELSEPMRKCFKKVKAFIRNQRKEKYE